MKSRVITPLEKYRKLHGYTQADLSEMTSISKVTISKWENSLEALRSGSSVRTKKVADALGITIEKLLGE